jgi:DNA-binding CsgD family transcriptional regulator
MAAIDLKPILATVYAAAIDPKHWTEALLALVHATGGSCAQLLVADLGKRRNIVSVNIDPNAAAHYKDQFRSFDHIPSHLAESAAGSIIVCRAANRGEPRETPFVEEWLNANEISDVVFVKLSDGHQPLWGIAVGHANGGKPFLSLECRQFLQDIAPHLANALAIGLSIQQANAKVAAAQAGWDSLKVGWFSLSSRGFVTYMNSVAHAILAQRDGFELRNGQLHAHDIEAQHGIHLAVQSAILDATRATRFGWPIRANRTSGAEAYRLRIIPLGERGPDPWADPPTVAILIYDSEREISEMSAMLRRQFGLTPAEARIAMRVCKGRGLAWAAESLGVSLSTARVQLQNVFEKTDVHRQAELVTLVDDLRI